MQSKSFNHTSEGWLTAPWGLLRCLRCLKSASSEGGFFWRLGLRLKLKEGRWALRGSGASSTHLSQGSPSAHTKAKKPLKRCDLWTCKTGEVNQYVMMCSGREEHMEGRHVGVAACLVDGNYRHAPTESTRPSGKDLRSDERWWMGGTLGREHTFTSVFFLVTISRQWLPKVHLGRPALFLEWPALYIPYFKHELWVL